VHGTLAATFRFATSAGAHFGHVRKVFFASCITQINIGVFGHTMGVLRNSIKAHLHLQVSLRFLVRFSPIDGCEWVNKLHLMNGEEKPTTEVHSLLIHSFTSAWINNAKIARHATSSGNPFTVCISCEIKQHSYNFPHEIQAGKTISIAPDRLKSKW
jgi:hypothetical protein